MVEYAMGSGGYLFRNEWPTYTFDGGLMLVVMICYLVWYPKQFQAGGDGSIELADSPLTVAT
jgi:hypothetical protein